MNCRVNRLNGRVLRNGQMGDYLQIGGVSDTVDKLKELYKKYKPKLKTLYLAATDKPVVEEVAPPEPVVLPVEEPQAQGFGIGSLLLVGLAALVLGGMMRGR